jgi:hypothetical protein
MQGEAAPDTFQSFNTFWVTNQIPRSETPDISDMTLLFYVGLSDEVRLDCGIQFCYVRYQ